MPGIDLVRRGGFAATLFASCFAFASDGRAQTTPAVCDPTESVSASQAANGLYTTTLTCAGTTTVEGATDYRHLHYKQGAGRESIADRDTSITNNLASNNLALTIGNGVVFTADGVLDVRRLPTDAAILLDIAGSKTLTIENGAVINLQRTPRGYTATDPNRPATATSSYNPAWYSFTTVLDRLAGVAAYSRLNDGDADIAITHNGVIEVDIELLGSYADGTSASGCGGTATATATGTPAGCGGNAGSAIDARVREERRFRPNNPPRTYIDIDIALGATGVIRHADGTDGLGGIYAENGSTDGNIRVNLAEGSLIDVSEGGGFGVMATTGLSYTPGNERNGDIIVNAHGTIRAAVKNKVSTSAKRGGTAIFAESDADSGRIRITSSGTIETVQGAAIDARATKPTNMQRDDPDTEEIEGHLVDVTGGTIETKGATAIYASISYFDSIAHTTSDPDHVNDDDTARANSHMTVRVADGATVRARALTAEDYENGAITQEMLTNHGNWYLTTESRRYHSWRKVDVTRQTAGGETETVKRLEPVITAIAVRDLSVSVPDGAQRDRVIVNGIVETIGGGSIDIDGTTYVDPAVWLEGGGVVVVGPKGHVSSDSGVAISGGCRPDYRSADPIPDAARNYATVDCDTVAARTLEVRVAGKVTGDIRVLDDGVLNLVSMEGSEISGTVHDPAGPLTVAGSVGRLLYSSGGAVTVTVAPTGSLTGVDGETIRTESGDLNLTVAGRVIGDLQAPRGGKLTLISQAGGTVTGTVRDPVGPLTVAGSIGRLHYSSGATVTVARTGRLTGVEVDGKTESLRIDSGDLNLTVAGTVTGDVRAADGGKLTLISQAGGTVTGTVRDPVGPLTVAGSIGRLLYSSGGAVTVTRTGRLTGVDGVALRIDSGNLDLTVAAMGKVTGDVDARGDGDLKVMVSGTVDGDIFGRGAGEHTVTVADGGSISGTVDLGASTVTANGAVGRVLLRRGGETTVGATGRLTGVDGMALRSDIGDLSATIAGMATGDIDARGAGDLTVMVSGTVDGDIFGRDAGAHAVTIVRGGRVTGTIDLGGDGTVTVEGMAGRVRFEENGSVTVGQKGSVPGGVESRSGAPAMTIVIAAGESESDARKRVGRICAAGVCTTGGEASIVYDRTLERKPPDPAPMALAPVPDGAYDVSLVRTASGEVVEVSRRLAPRTRVYEALPSVLLGMERPASHAERATAARAPNGAWARVDASRGSWEAVSSANAGSEYDHRGFSLQAGVDAALGEDAQAGVSVHWRRATAEVSQGGEVEARGVGVGVSATWSSGPVYVDGQAAATLYDLDLTSTARGALKDDARAHGLSAALEAGRMVPVADGVTVTPRARVAYSSLSLSGFDDSVGARVSLDDGRSLTGRAGALAERVFGESRIFGSLDIEHEFEAETRMSVSGTSLKAASDEARWLAGVGAEHGWDDGRFAVHGALGYTGSGDGTHDYGARASLSMRF